MLYLKLNIYKPNLALNNPQGLLCYKTQPNTTKQNQQAINRDKKKVEVPVV